MRSLILLFVLTTSAHAVAEEFDYLGKHEELKENTILMAGNIEKLEPPYGKQWTGSVLRMSTQCLQTQTTDQLGYWSYGKKAGLLLINKFEIYKVAIFERDPFSIKVSILQVEPVDCSTLLTDQPRDPKTIIENMKKQQEIYERRRLAIQRELDRLKQRNKAE